MLGPRLSRLHPARGLGLAARLGYLDLGSGLRDILGFPSERSWIRNDEK